MIGLHFGSDNIQGVFAGWDLHSADGVSVLNGHLVATSLDLTARAKAQEGVSSELFAALDTLQQEPRAMTGAQF